MNSLSFFSSQNSKSYPLFNQNRTLLWFFGFSIGDQQDDRRQSSFPFYLPQKATSTVSGIVCKLHEITQGVRSQFLAQGEQCIGDTAVICIVLKVIKLRVLLIFYLKHDFSLFKQLLMMAPGPGAVLISQGLPSKYHTEWLIATGSDHLPVLEVESLKSSRQQGHDLSLQSPGTVWSRPLSEPLALPTGLGVALLVSAWPPSLVPSRGFSSVSFLSRW